MERRVRTRKRQTLGALEAITWRPEKGNHGRHSGSGPSERRNDGALKRNQEVMEGLDFWRLATDIKIIGTGGHSCGEVEQAGGHVVWLAGLRQT